MVSTNEYAWQPNLDDPAYWRGEIVPVSDAAPARLRRAPWSWIEDCLAGHTPSAWSQVRYVRLDGPKATDATLRTLAEKGALDQVTRLDLASSAFSAQALRIALALPQLDSLRCESVTASEDELAPSTTLRRLELRGCAGATCCSLLHAAPQATAVDIGLVEQRGDAAAVQDVLGGLSLESLALRHMACTRRHLESALQSSHATLERLTLDSVSGLESDQFLAAADWSALATLELRASTIKRIEGHLPDTLISLSLARSEIRELSLDRRPWPSDLRRLDLIGQPLSQGLVDRLCRDPERLHALGLGSGSEANRVLAALTAATNSALCELELGEGPGVGVWHAPQSASLTALLPALERLRVVGQMPVGRGNSGWRVDEAIVTGVLRGEVAPGLRDLSMRHMSLGNPELDGGFAPALRALEFDACTGFIQGLAGAGNAHPMARVVLDGVEVAEAELSAWIARCSGLRSLVLARIPGFGPDGLAAALAPVADTLLQLVLEGFNADGDAGYAAEWRNALTASRYPQLAELVLYDVSMNATALATLLGQGDAPHLERLAFDPEAMGQDAWLAIAEHAPPNLHWIAATGTGARDDLAWLLDAPDSRISAACVALS